jgi:hypothetical protein
MTQDNYIDQLASKITEAAYKETDPKDYTPWQKAVAAKSKEDTIKHLPYNLQASYKDERNDPEFQKYMKDLQSKLFPNHKK